MNILKLSLAILLFLPVTAYAAPTILTIVIPAAAVPYLEAAATHAGFDNVDDYALSALHEDMTRQNLQADEAAANVVKRDAARSKSQAILNALPRPVRPDVRP